MSKKKIVDFYAATPRQVRKLVKDYSDGSLIDKFWTSNYLQDDIHGLAHGLEVSDTITLLANHLTANERESLDREGKSIGSFGLKTAIAVARMGGYLHDCGRFATKYSLNSGKDGLWEIGLQNMHPDFGADRAASLIYASKFSDATKSVPFLREGIASHEFQSRRLTPQYTAPATMIGKLIQAADQLRWFRPGSISSTERYNESRGVPFFRDDVSMDERTSWIANTPSRDALTVMLAQVCGPTGSERFGTEYSRVIAIDSKRGSKNELIQLCEKRGIVSKANEIIREYEKIIND